MASKIAAPVTVGIYGDGVSQVASFDLSAMPAFYKAGSGSQAAYTFDQSNWRDASDVVFASPIPGASVSISRSIITINFPSPFSSGTVSFFDLLVLF